jgi:hypothetical protein
MSGSWPRIYVVKKGHARDIYYIFLLADAQFLVLQRPLFLSLRAAIYSPVPFIGCAGSLTSSPDPVVLPFCRSKEFALV